jgi:cytochrome c oxidase cbb3-type subunit 3
VIRRWVTIALVSLLFLLCAAAFVAMAWVRASQGHGGQVYPSEIRGLAIREPPADPSADARRRGEVVYRHYCQICHGKQGKGDGFNADKLEVPPGDFTNEEFWRQTSDERELEYRLKDSISKGGPSIGKSVLMPGWGHTLSEKQIRDVIVYVHAFAPRPEAHDK